MVFVSVIGLMLFGFSTLFFSGNLKFLMMFISIAIMLFDLFVSFYRE